MEHLAKTIDGETIFKDLSFTINRTDKVALSAGNERAMRQLCLKYWIGNEEPDEGFYKWGNHDEQDYFPHDYNADFDNNLTIADWLTQYSENKDTTHVRGFPHRMLLPERWRHKTCPYPFQEGKRCAVFFRNDDFRR